MKSVILLLTATLFLFGCSSDDDNGGSPPPKEFVGNWATDGADTTPQAVNNANPCQGFTITDEGIDTGMVRVDPNGTVWYASKVKSAGEPYKVAGTVNTAKQFVMTPEFEKEYFPELQTFKSQPGVTAVVSTDVSYQKTELQGEILVFDISVTMSAQGFTMPIENWFTMTMRKVQPETEKKIIGNAKACAANENQ